MPTIVRLSDTLRICMYAGDHNPPHFHLIASDRRACMVRLDTLEVIRGTIDARSFAQAVAWAGDNGDLLARRWADLNERD
ncbi:DUF4160 domain-containing protein [Lichenihabitans sp. Uapishka_5]|uniref:DUF4160 domain-containing protein n=1 Tax=Lichenihabitans sp. Uapishka_5 TaxID=3037302 RepID=UPI0029E7D5CA|nr:DUF4160 domain-containing protein [Lichenihabitans sp. Uapishka_5]MDX7952716.1 DUF4160 domain-containing protein [Lichenihabitans sp. Uapishka_5]